MGSSSVGREPRNMKAVEVLKEQGKCLKSVASEDLDAVGT